MAIAICSANTIQDYSQTSVPNMREVESWAVSKANHYREDRIALALVVVCSDLYRMLLEFLDL